MTEAQVPVDRMVLPLRSRNSSHTESCPEVLEKTILSRQLVKFKLGKVFQYAISQNFMIMPLTQFMQATNTTFLDQRQKTISTQFIQRHTAKL